MSIIFGKYILFVQKYFFSFSPSHGISVGSKGHGLSTLRLFIISRFPTRQQLSLMSIYELGLSCSGRDQDTHLRSAERPFVTVRIVKSVCRRERH